MIDYGKEQLNELIERLRNRFVDYLRERGVLGPDWTLEKNQRIHCISPDHDDQHESMDFIKSSNGTRIMCWSCGKSADIFQAAVWLEGLPSGGSEWVRETVYYLAKQLNEDFQEVEPTEEELARAKILNMLSDAADVLRGMTKTNPDAGYKHTRARGLSDDICFEMGVGTVNHDEFIDTLKKYGGWDPNFAKANGLTSSTFGDEHITITLHDHRGMVVGFDRRFVHYNAEEARACRKMDKPYPPKYMAPVRSSVFNPDTFIYGIHLAKAESWKTLEMFEGYFSTLSGRQAGLKSCGSLCGTQKLTEGQINLLAEIGFRDVCLCMDCDDAGRKAVERYIEALKEQTKIRFSFRMLGWRATDNVQDKDKDPDTFFRLYCKKSLKQYEQMPVFSLFRMSLDLEAMKGKGGDVLAKAQLVHIASESDPIQRGKMIMELAERTNVNEEDLRTAVNNILDKRSKKMLREMVHHLEDPTLTPKEALSLLSRTQMKMSHMLHGGEDAVTASAAKATFFEAMDRMHSPEGVIAGHRTGIKWIDEKWGGYPGCAFVNVAGSMNTGKSAMIHFIMNGLLRHHAENKGLCIVMFSFDDSSDWAYAKQLAIQSGLPITWCAKPTEFIFPHQDRARKYRDAEAFYQEAVGPRLRVFGGNVGMTMPQIDRAVKNVQDDTGYSTLIVVDSFNKIQSAEGLSGTPMFERHADQLQEFKHHGQSVLCSAEIVKSAMGFKPTPQDVKDCGKLLYDADMNILMYNPLNDLRDQSKFFWVTTHPDDPTDHLKAAVVQTDIWKNRVGNYKGSDAFKMNNFVGTFECVPDLQAFMAVEREKWRTLGKAAGMAGNTRPAGSSPFTPNQDGRGFSANIDIP